MTAGSKPSWSTNLALAALVALFFVIRWWIFLVIPALLTVAIIVWGVVFERRRSKALIRFRSEHVLVGKDLLIVYSTSPNWSDYIEANWFKRWGSRAVIVNLSNRPAWKRETTSEAQLYRAFVTGHKYHPLAVHVPLQGPEQFFSFRSAFHDYKHGNTTSLGTLESQLAAALDGTRVRNMIDLTDLEEIASSPTTPTNVRRIAGALASAINDWPTFNLVSLDEYIDELEREVGLLTTDNIRAYAAKLTPSADAWKLESVASLLDAWDTPQSTTTLEELIHELMEFVADQKRNLTRGEQHNLSPNTRI